MPFGNIHTRCEACQFWVTTQPGGTPKRIGQCRRFPPQFVSEVSSYSRNLGGGDVSEGISTNTEADWPVTSSGDWCGEFKAET